MAERYVVILQESRACHKCHQAIARGERAVKDRSLISVKGDVRYFHTTRECNGLGKIVKVQGSKPRR